MTDIWAKLAEPFPDSEVKQRPGRGSMTFSYIDARAVMQRLDDVLTPDGWDFASSVIPGTDVVHGVLTIAGKVREDYGYPNSDHDEEPIKAASSDALKRCAVMFGVGRHLYSDNRPVSSGRAASPPPARPSARPVSSNPEFRQAMDASLSRAADDVYGAPPVRPSAPTTPPDLEDPTLDAPPMYETVARRDPYTDAPSRQTAQAGSGGVMWSKALFEAAEAAGIERKMLTDTSKRLFGKDKWKVTELTDGERWTLAYELGLVAA